MPKLLSPTGLFKAFGLKSSKGPGVPGRGLRFVLNPGGYKGAPFGVLGAIKRPLWGNPSGGPFKPLGVKRLKNPHFFKNLAPLLGAPIVRINF